MPSPPSPPDPNKVAAAGQIASIENYPFEYIINQLAQLGQSSTINGTTYDFSGLGNAAQAAGMGGQTAQGELALQQLYGPQFVQQALAQLQQANPLGTSAESQLGSLVMEAPPGPSGTSESLEQNMLGLLNNPQLSGGPFGQTTQVEQGVRAQQLGQGIFLGNEPAAQEAGAVESANQSQLQQIQAATENYLQAGVSPEDVLYRQVQQQLANQGAFWAGQTPLAQFGSLGAAQTGAAPYGTNYAPSPGINTGAALTGLQNANQLYSGNVNWYQSQMNPYLAGLSGLTGAAGLAMQSPSFNPFLGSNPYAALAAGTAAGSGYTGAGTGYVPSGSTDTGLGPYE